MKFALPPRAQPPLYFKDAPRAFLRQKADQATGFLFSQQCCTRCALENLLMPTLVCIRVEVKTAPHIDPITAARHHPGPNAKIFPQAELNDVTSHCSVNQLLVMQSDLKQYPVATQVTEPSSVISRFSGTAPIICYFINQRCGS